MKSAISGRLKEKGYKITSPRESLFALLAARRQPLTVEEIAAALKKDRINQATVYRMLKTFEKEGLIRRVEFKHDHAHYELKEDKDHHHIVCVVCHATEDVTDCDLSKATAKILSRSKKFAKINDHSLEFFGLCRSCQHQK